MKTRQWNWGSKQLLRGVFILFLVAGTLACSEDDVTSTTPETPENPNGDVWGIERSGFFNGREKWAKGFENQRV